TVHPSAFRYRLATDLYIFRRYSDNIRWQDVSSSLHFKDACPGVGHLDLIRHFRQSIAPHDFENLSPQFLLSLLILREEQHGPS
ncbi:hypothetical protein PENTCL1PPCAC_28246, partial [Pristionchus entomophagus]